MRSDLLLLPRNRRNAELVPAFFTADRTTEAKSKCLCRINGNLKTEHVGNRLVSRVEALPVSWGTLQVKTAVECPVPVIVAVFVHELRSGLAKSSRSGSVVLQLLCFGQVLNVESDLKERLIPFAFTVPCVADNEGFANRHRIDSDSDLANLTPFADPHCPDGFDWDLALLALRRVLLWCVAGRRVSFGRLDRWARCVIVVPVSVSFAAPGRERNQARDHEYPLHV